MEALGMLMLGVGREALGGWVTQSHPWDEIALGS